jgi:hypothetical protein
MIADIKNKTSQGFRKQSKEAALHKCNMPKVNNKE